jgi:hypothetical protein
VIAVVVIGLAATVTALLMRSAAPAGGLAATAKTPVSAGSQPAPSASPLQPASSPSPSPTGQQGQRYRTYVSTAMTDATALAAALTGLEGCGVSREVCKHRIGEASTQVAQFQRELAANPAPTCLSGADQRLRDGLSFESRGLSLAEQAVDSRNRLKLAQGLLLVAAGTWREGQAIWAARHSDC